ncbi:glycosyltransferase family 4 protein [Endozoicomonas sp. GU-1]|uniref:glycosyltransferase family 4 protein n=1 Tax=Endozoicomonas sp. GU-1 TaxID=3009078 RepID=UPI0022B3CC03|nr:glycosyltransferase family 4 protein [Endozoicomonas sp. GU-1]WBA81512.1 glycosyltransferase family 4 protein [Endozoicomonas sp. GU-1]WBA84460.1 glycosyltransferase family 4 protein [Endozoicomonas sp. GU-1]
MTRTSILHIHADYPDNSGYNSTPAVKNLIKLASEYKHYVFAIHRTNIPNRIKIIKKDENLFSLFYFGFPLGSFLKYSAYYLAKKIACEVRSNNIEISLIHSHKITCEGSVGFYLSKMLNKPLICTVQGGTDSRFLKYGVGNGSLYEEVVYHSKKILFMSVWAKKNFEKLPTYDENKTFDFPIPCVNKVLQVAKPKKQKEGDHLKLVCVALNQYKLKGIIPLIYALTTKELRLKMTLDIIGMSDPVEINAINKAITKCNLMKRVKLLGRVKHDKLLEMYTNYDAFVLPSAPESFGMVYVEALFAGLPILFHKNTGIDGYLDGLEVGIGIENKSATEISNALNHMGDNINNFKNNVFKAIKNGKLAHLTNDHIIETYRNVVEETIGLNHE